MSVQPKHMLEYAALRFMSGLLSMLPYRVALGLGWGLARMAYQLDPAPVRKARTRIRSVLGPDAPAARVNQIAWISLRNIVFNLVEGMRLSHLTRDWFARHYPNAAPAAQQVREIFPDGTGGIIAVPHMGNWELAGCACQVHAIPVLVILGKQRNPLSNAWLRQTREALGMTALERGTDIMRPIVRRIKEGKTLAILPDSRMPYPDLLIPFMGGTANLGSGMALFARLTNSTILPCLPIREGWTQHRVELLEPVAPLRSKDKAADLQTMTEAVVRQLDEGIRRYPEQWFWYNSRWVLDPVESAPRHEDTTASST